MIYFIKIVHLFQLSIKVKAPSANKKYNEIMTTARDLFWKHGFKRVSIEEVCRKAGVSKMTFYRFFPNKADLAKVVFDQVMEEGKRRFITAMEEATTSEELIRKMLLLKLEGTNDISVEFLEDFYSHPELGLKTYVEERTALQWQEILHELKIAQERGLIRKEMNLEFYFALAQRTVDLLTDEKFQQMFDTPQALVMEMANFFAYGISPRK